MIRVVQGNAGGLRTGNRECYQNHDARNTRRQLPGY